MLLSRMAARTISRYPYTGCLAFCTASHAGPLSFKLTWVVKDPSNVIEDLVLWDFGVLPAIYDPRGYVPIFLKFFVSLNS